VFFTQLAAEKRASDVEAHMQNMQVCETVGLLRAVVPLTNYALTFNA